jgi:rubrerythrin
VAELQEEKGAQRSANWALQAEKVHAGMYQKAKQAVERKEDIALGPVFICEACGYTVEGSAQIDVQYAALLRRSLGSFKTDWP